MSFRVSNRVTRVRSQELRGYYANWTFHPMEPRFACGSMVLALSFSQKLYTLCKIFVKKHGFFRPAGGGISCRVNDHVTPFRSGTT